MFRESPAGFIEARCSTPPGEYAQKYAQSAAEEAYRDFVQPSCRRLS